MFQKIENLIDSNMTAHLQEITAHLQELTAVDVFFYKKTQFNTPPLGPRAPYKKA
jgi:hypothetical protein